MHGLCFNQLNQHKPELKLNPLLFKYPTSTQASSSFIVPNLYYPHSIVGAPAAVRLQSKIHNYAACSSCYTLRAMFGRYR